MTQKNLLYIKCVIKVQTIKDRNKRNNNKLNLKKKNQEVIKKLHIKKEIIYLRKFVRDERNNF